eukprot:SAG11_NODE_10121_length_853_cov_1.440318_1_plen_213_part_10
MVSTDLAHWVRLGVALWNDHWYDRRAVFTGSVTVVGSVPHIIYPGLCDPKTPAICTSSGATYALARPANLTDPLLQTWTKLSTNPILNGTADDPTTAWMTASGGFRLLGNSGAAGQKSKSFAPVFGAPSITGPWKLIGDSPFPAGECPSLFELPPLTHAAMDSDALPTHVYIRGYDRASFYVLGTYHDDGVGIWNNTGSVPFAQRRIDNGNIY